MPRPKPGRQVASGSLEECFSMAAFLRLVNEEARGSLFSLPLFSIRLSAIYITNKLKSQNK